MHHTWKGLYLKFRSENGVISNVLYENIYIEVRKKNQSQNSLSHPTTQAPEQWAIWIGPAQQAVSSNLCHASPCRSHLAPVANVAYCGLVGFFYGPKSKFEVKSNKELVYG